MGPDGRRRVGLAEDGVAVAPRDFAALESRLVEDAAGLPDADFIRFAYRHVFGREVDDAGARHYAGKLADESLDRPAIVRELLLSPEMRTRVAAGGEMASAWDARARDDARFFIASGDSTSDEEFVRSGERDLDEVVLHGVELRESAEALEIGCGVGRLLLPLSRRARRAAGVDISPAMIDDARRFLSSRPNVRVDVTDGTLSQWAAGSFDFAYSYLVFQHVPDIHAIARYVAEAGRVLRPGGVFRFQVDGRFGTPAAATTYEGVRLSPAEVRGMTARAGLEIRSEWGAGTHYYWIDAEKPGLREERPARLRRWRANEEFLSGIASGSASLREVLRDRLAHLPADNTSFVRGLFALLLQREPRPDEIAFHGGALTKGWASRDDIVDSLLTCGEFMNLAKRFDP